jgi:hypothetical protein
MRTGEQNRSAKPVKKKGNADWQPRQVTTRKINVDLIGSG